MSQSVSSFNNFISKFIDRSIGLIYDDCGQIERAVLVSPAQDIRAQTVNEILTLSNGLLHVAVSPARAQGFALQKMATARSGVRQLSGPGECVSVEAREGVGSGISASDRARTISILGENEPHHRKLVSPGHIFPVEVRDAGVLARSSLREAALDIVKIAEFSDAALVVDILDKSGNFLSRAGQESLCKEHAIPTISISEVIRYRLETEKLAHCVAQAPLPSRLGSDLRSYIYKSTFHDGEHLALVKGDIDSDKPILTRVQPEFTFGDVFGGKNPPTRKILHRCLEHIEKSECGVLIYLRRPDRGQLRDQVSTWQTKYKHRPAHMMREYGLGAQILFDLGVRKIHLLTNSKTKLIGLKSFGIEVVATSALGDH